MPAIEGSKKNVFLLLFVLTCHENCPPDNFHLGKSFFLYSKLNFLLTKNLLLYFPGALYTQAPFMAYIAMSSYIYENYFALDAQAYSYFFCCQLSLCSSWSGYYLRSIEWLTPRNFCWCCFGVALASGLGVLFLGDRSPWVFLVAYLPFTLIGGAMRPFSTNILLDQQQADIGSASSL